MRTLVGVAIGLMARPLLDALMGRFPGSAQQIDVLGQFVVALVVGWFCLIPILGDYGVVGKKQAQ